MSPPPVPDSRYRSVVETMSEGVVVQNADGTTELCNARALELFGVTEDELKASFDSRDRWHSIRLDGSAYSPEQLPVNVTLRTGEPIRDVVMGITRRDGVFRWLSVNSRAICEGGRVTAVVCTFSDVTNRHELERARRATEERFRVVADRVGSMIFDHDLVTGELYRSEALAAEFLWHVSEPNHEWWLARIHPDDVERVRAVVRSVLDATGGDAQWSIEYRFRRGDGKWVPVIERGAVLRRDDGTPVRCIGTVMDASDRAELASQLRQAQKMEVVGQLAGGIAHDFNNLLTAISCNVELLLEAISPSDARRDDVVQIREAADRAATLTRQLLAFSRRQVLQSRALDLNVTVSGMERLLCRVISGDVRLHTELEPALPTVFADAGQMEQVMMNLVLNARDAMPVGGTIVVRTGRTQLRTAQKHRFGTIPPGDYVTLSVRDAGTGMAPDVVERLFEPFFTTKPQGKGTGLGLATVHGIVLQSSGYITVVSALGLGSEFTVYLPAHQATAAPAAPALAARGPVRQAGRMVLVVDDEAAVRDVTMRAVMRAGYRVLGASSGAQALELLSHEEDHSVVLLLTDIMMPEMSGHELVARVAERFPAVRIASMSGYTSDELSRRGHAAHPQLHKPFTLPQLIAFVNDAFTAERAVA
jgi:PAS domain S-box-containing protein